MSEARSSRSEPGGITALRAARGDEHVTFAEVADHLHDFTHRCPQARGTIDVLARFLAAVEGRPHAHDEDTTRTEAAGP